MTLQLFSDLFRYGSQAGQIILLVCLLRRHLTGRYRFFCGFLCAQLLESVALFGIDSHSAHYSSIWSVAQVPVWIFQLLAILELMSFVFEHYPKIGEFARVIVTSSFAVSSILAASIAVIEIPGSASMPLSLLFSWEVTKFMAWTSFMVLGVQAVWFLLFPVPMRPNVKLHRLLLSWYAGLSPGILILVAESSNVLLNDIANVCLLCSAAICLALWAIRMRRAGETEPDVAPFSAIEISRFETDFEAGKKALDRISWKGLFR